MPSTLVERLLPLVILPCGAAETADWRVALLDVRNSPAKEKAVVVLNMR